MSEHNQAQNKTLVTPLTHHVANSQLVELIPLSAKVILEIGCGSGASGELYLRRNPRARYVGLEISENYAAIARQYITECHVGNIETIDVLELTGGVKIDCIVFGDVLEHLQNPWSVLSNLKAVLSPGGCIAACVPNTGHWSVIANLLSGQWPYADTGLFDRTHLRFFTQQSLRHLFESSGLYVSELRPRIFIHSPNEQLVPKLLETSCGIGINNSNLEQELNTFQWLIRGTLVPAQPLIVHACIHPPYGGMSDVRVELPLRALSSEPGVTLGTMTAHYVLSELSSTPNADTLFIWQRAISSLENIKIIDEIAKKDIKTIVDFDDDPEPHQSSFPAEINVFSRAAGTQASTNELGQYFKEIGANCEVFNNSLFELPPAPLPLPRGTEGKLNFFFGAINREDDWAPYIDHLNEVLAERVNQVHVNVIYDRSFFDALKTPHKSFAPLCDYAAFHEHLRHADIAWLPLNDTQKNRRKSDLKFVEASAHGAVSIASHVLYGNTVVDGQTGLLYTGPEQFKQQLLRLLTDSDLRQTLSTNSRQYVSQHRMLAYDNARRLDWYRRCASFDQANS